MSSCGLQTKFERNVCDLQHLEVISNFNVSALRWCVFWRVRFWKDIAFALRLDANPLYFLPCFPPPWFRLSVCWSKTGPRWSEAEVCKIWKTDILIIWSILFFNIDLSWSDKKDGLPIILPAWCEFLKNGTREPHGWVCNYLLFWYWSGFFPQQSSWIVAFCTFKIQFFDSRDPWQRIFQPWTPQKLLCFSWVFFVD